MVLTQEGGNRLWKWILGIVAPVNPFVHLLGSYYNPLHTSTLSNFTANELPLASGYAPIQLVNPSSDWTLTGITAGEQATYNLLTWTFTGAKSVYGYYVSDDTDTVSIWGEVFGVYYTFPAGGGVFTLSLPPYLISCPGVSSC